MLGITSLRERNTDRISTYVLICPFFLIRKYFIMLVSPVANSAVEQWNIVQCASKKLEIKCANFSQ